jgi:hypothetical protein
VEISGFLGFAAFRLSGRQFGTGDWKAWATLRQRYEMFQT